MQTAERKPLVTVIDPLKPEPVKLRVAAYARVSTDSLDQRRLSEQNLVLVRLKSKGYMNESMYLSQLDEMNLKLRELRKLRRKILASASEDNAIQTTQEMINYFENSPELITEMTPEIFEVMVERIILISATQIKFRLKNGLELTEAIGRGKG